MPPPLQADETERQIPFHIKGRIDPMAPVPTLSTHCFPKDCSRIQKAHTRPRRARAPSPIERPFHLKPLAERLRLTRLAKDKHATVSTCAEWEKGSRLLCKGVKLSREATFQPPVRTKLQVQFLNTRAQAFTTYDDNARIYNLRKVQTHYAGPGLEANSLHGRILQLPDRTKVESPPKTAKITKTTVEKSAASSAPVAGCHTKAMFRWQAYHPNGQTRSRKCIFGGASRQVTAFWATEDLTTPSSTPEAGAQRKETLDLMVRCPIPCYVTILSWDLGFKVIISGREYCYRD